MLPGNQNDAKCVAQVQKDMNDWKLGNVIWAMDRYLKELKSGKLAVDKSKVKNDQQSETHTTTSDSEEIKKIKHQPAKDGTLRGGPRPGAGRKWLNSKWPSTNT